MVIVANVFFITLLIASVVKLLFPEKVLAFLKKSQLKETAAPGDACITMARVSSLSTIAFALLAIFLTLGL